MYNGIQLSHQKEQNTDTHKDIDKSQEYYAEPHELDTEVYTTCFHLCETRKQGKLIYSDSKQIMRGLSEVMEIFSTLITMVVVVMDTFVKHAKLTFSMGAFLLYMNYSSGKSIFFKCASINYVLKMLKGFRIYEASGCRGRQEGASGWRAWNWHAPISREGFLKQIFLLRGEKADQGKETTGAKQKSGVFTYWEKRKLITIFWSYFFWQSNVAKDLTFIIFQHYLAAKKHILKCTND